MINKVRRARLHKNAKRHVSRLLTFSFLLSLIGIPLTSTSARADTAGTGTCQQTFTKTGTGQVDVVESGGYCYVAFKNTGAVDTQTTFSWTRPTGATTADVLVVGGGGGGGSRHGGGGGAGAYVEASSFTISAASSISIAVGAGGRGAPGGSTYQGASGQTSYFKSGSNGLTALGGGYGSYNVTAANGGSGGGAGWGQAAGSVSSQAQTTFSGSSLSGINFGNAGGVGANEGVSGVDYWAGGGGGGAAAAGQNPKLNGVQTTAFGSGDRTLAVAGAGGDGKTPNWISTTLATTLTIGENSGGSVYFAGGGGGGMGADGSSGGPGGLGGGADGTRSESTGNNGTASTGGGGGGSGFDDVGTPLYGVQNPEGGDGGSGVVVVRYQSTFNVTYNSNGGSSVTSGTFTVGGSIASAPNAPTLNGYRFAGWSATSGGSIISFPYAPGVASDITLYANWIGIPFLSYNSSDLNSYSSSATTVTDLSGNAFNATTVGSVSFDASTGTSTGSWSLPGGTNAAGPYIDVSNLSSSNFSGGFTIDFEADFGSQKNNFERIIDFGEGGSSNDNLIVSRDGTTSNLFLEVWRGSVGSRCTFTNGISEGVLTRYTVVINGSTCRVFKDSAVNPDFSTSYTTLPVSGLTWIDNFIGKSNWTADAQYEGKIRSLRLYASAFTPAQIDAISYKTVTFNSNNGTATGITSGVTSGKMKLATTPTRTGYTFNGWYDASSGGNLIGAGNADYTPSSTTTLHAQWTANTQTITYAAGTGGSGSAPSSPTSVSYGSTFTTPANTYTRSGYTFAGWSDGTRTYAAGDTYPNTGTVSGNVTLTATWIINCAPTLTSPTGYRIYSFTTVGTCSWQVPDGVTTYDVLVVAGGGGGGSGGDSVGGGGGGAGGVIESSSVSLSGSVAIAVGAGGSGGGSSTWWTSGSNGENSSIGSSLVAIGGGAGGGRASAGSTGGSGGGAGGRNVISSGALGTSNQGFSGGTVSATFSHGSGGGGAGAIGSGSSSTVVGLGGAGKPSSITGTSITYAVGGNGGNRLNSTTYSSASSAAYGSGGHGSGGNFVQSSGGWGRGQTGASGIVVIRYSISEYVVTYDSNGGSSIPNDTYTVGGTAITLPTPTRSGYTFAGWFESSALTGSALSSTYTPTQNRTVYAKWTANTQTITYAAGTGGSGSAPSSPTSVSYGSTFTTPANTYTRTGYTFAGWSDGTRTYAAGDTYPNTGTVSGNVTLTATWTANTQTITYAAGTGGSGSAPSSPTSVSYGSTFTTPANTYTRTGYTFAGWSDGTRTYAAGDTYPNTGTVSGNVTLTATWTSDTYTITYDSNGGSSISNGSFIVGGTAITLPTPTKTGYTFAGWFEASNLSGSALASPYTPTQTRTIYAKWTANSNTVTFNSNYGTPTTSTQSITSGSATSLTSNSFTRSGYTFAGWNTLANGTGTAYTNSQSVTIYAPFTLYAQWTEINYTVTYDRNGASGSPEKSSEVYGIDSTGALTLPTIGSMTKTGYRFDGWATSNGGSKLTSPYTPSANVTLYARWVAASYTITYDTNSATSGSPSTTSDSYTTGGSAITFATQSTMARTGYSFNGWSTTRNDATTKVSNLNNYTISAPVILYALWTANNYSITYSDQNKTSGTAPTDSTVYNIGNVAYVKANSALVRTGYTFAGWTTTSDNSGTVYQSGDSYTLGAANVTFYPKWTANTYNITYNTNGAASGSPSRTSDTYTSGTTGLSLPNVGTMVRTGYDFSGWSTSPTGSAHSGLFTTTSDVTLYAIWTLKSISYSYARGVAEGTNLTDAHIATFPNPTSDSSLYGTSITLSSTISSTATVGANSYLFFGWNDGNTTYQPGNSFVMGANSSTFTAQWIRLYAVRYGLNGGSGIVSVDSECTQTDNSCTPNQSITLSAAPTRTGYTFNGWIDQSGTTFSAGATTNVTSTSYVYYAQWTAVNYSITFDSIGGSNSPATQTKNIGQSVTLPDPGTRTGYDFSGWTLGGVTYGVGTTYTVGSTNAAFTALWTAKRFNVSYDWNGGVGTPTASSIYTYGNAAITLPTGSSHTKDGYVFNGWKDQDGNTIGTTHTPTQDTRYVAQWIDGSYTLTYNTVGGTLAQSSVNVARTTSTTLPTPTRTNYTFDGWYEDSSTTVLHGQAGSSVTPTSSRTLYAKWVQDSLTGINPAHLNSLTSITTQNGNAASWTGSHSLSGTGASLTIPADALPNGTVVQVSFVEDLTRPASLINANYAYYTSVVLHWQLGTGSSATVPVAATGKPLVLTLTNPDIRAGAKIYKIIRGEAREVATATQDGQVTINVYEDPEIVVAATAPSAPLSVTAVGNLNAQSTVSWTAPASSGGAEVTSYTVTSSPGNQTCTATGTTSCTVSGLTNDSTYTFTVVANNAVGSSVASAASSGIIPRLRPTFNATFDSKGGSSVSGTLFNNTDGIAQPSAPTKSGYNFGGWLNTDGDSSTLVTFPYSPNVNSDVTLYAYWTSTGVSSGAGTSSNVPTVSPVINAPATSRVDSNNTPLINMPAAPTPVTGPVSKFPELQNAPYPTNGLNVPAVGEVITLINRVPVQPTISMQQNQTVIEFGESLSMTLAPKTTSGTEIPPTADGVLQVLQGSVIDAAGTGFKAGSPVEAWVYSTPTRLGSGIADSNGVFEQTFRIDDEFKLGKHTIVLNGLTPKNEIFTVALGIQVLDQIPTDETPIQEDQSNLPVRALQVLSVIALFLILRWLMRRPRKH